MADRIADKDLARYLGQRIIDDADKLRLFVPDCYARFPVAWDDHEYEVRVYYKGKTNAA